MPDMNEIRERVLDRIEHLTAARSGLRLIDTMLDEASASLREAWAGYEGQTYATKDEGINALGYFVSSEGKRIEDDLHAAVVQFAGLFVRDVIGEELRTSNVPVVALTGNSYMPPIRSYAEVERIWQLDEPDLFETFFETLDQKLNEANFIVGSPDYDNMLYGVDGNRWTYTGGMVDEDPNGWLDKQNYSAIRD